MSQERYGIKVLGLSLLAALGLMAFAAVAAQAGEFKVEATPGTVKTFTAHGLAQESVSGTIAAGKLLVSGLGLTISCTGGTFTGTALLGGVAHISALFSGCQASAVCKTYETKEKMDLNTVADRGFISAAGLGQLVLMGTAPNVKHYLLVESTSFTTIYFQKVCPLPLESVVSGSTVLALPNALTMLKEQPVQTITQVELESLWEAAKGENNVNTLLYLNQVAWLDGGEAKAGLSGALTNKPWGGE